MVDNFTGVLDDARYNNDATATVGSRAVGRLTYARPKLTWSWDVPPGKKVTIRYTFGDVRFRGNGRLVNAATSNYGVAVKVSN